MNKTILFYSALICLTGCVTTDEEAQREQQFEITQCLNLGFAPNTPEFANCRLQVWQADAAHAAMVQNEPVIPVDIQVTIGGDDHHDDDARHQAAPHPENHDAHDEKPDARDDKQKCEPSNVAGTVCKVN